MADDIVWFASKVDWWLGAILVMLPLTMLGVLALALYQGSGAQAAVSILACGLVGALYGLLIFPLRYGIGAQELIIRHGIVRQRVRLDAIKEVKPTRNPLSSPALSLDRLEIRTSHKWFNTILISPADREGFVQALCARSGLTRQGNRLAR